MLKEFRESCREHAVYLAFAKRQMEMEVFALNKDGKPSAPSGFHDDTIMSAAIAVRLLDYPDRMEPPEMELDFRKAA